MTGREKLDAEERKQRMYYDQNCECYFCHKPLRYSQAEFAHCIPNTKGYIKKYGIEVIHNKKNGRITCHGCNHKALLDPKTNPVPATELVAEIENDLGVMG